MGKKDNERGVEGEVRSEFSRGLDTGAMGFHIKYLWLGEDRRSRGKKPGRTGVGILSAESRVQHLCKFPLGL